MTILSSYFIYLLGIILSFYFCLKLGQLLGLKKSWQILFSLSFSLLPFIFSEKIYSLQSPWHTWIFIVPLFFYYFFSQTSHPSWLKTFIFVPSIFQPELALIAALINVILYKIQIKKTHFQILLLSALLTGGGLVGLKIFNGPLQMTSGNFLSGTNQGFRIFLLLAPQDQHQFKSLAKHKIRYNNRSTLIGKNSSMNLGILGSVGFILVVGQIIMNFSQRKTSPQYAFPHLGTLSLIFTLALVLGHIGGMGAIINFFGIHLIHYWFLAGIFVAICSLLTLMIYLQHFFQKKLELKFNILQWIMMIFMGVLIYFDQIPAKFPFS
jgi:hypothetical protein